MTKSKAAFFFNCERMAHNKGVFLWTFTTKKAMSYTEFRKRWNVLLTHLKKRNPEWRGVRIFEVHPGCASFGASHGLHVHVVTNKYFNVNKIRSVVKASGWGRIHVVRCDKCEATALYLGKYLSKKRPHALKGWRLWQCFGDFDRSKCVNIHVDSFNARVWRWCKDNWTGWHELSFGERAYRVARFSFVLIAEDREITREGVMVPPFMSYQKSEFDFMQKMDEEEFTITLERWRKGLAAPLRHPSPFAS